MQYRQFCRKPLRRKEVSVGSIEDKPNSSTTFQRRAAGAIDNKPNVSELPALGLDDVIGDRRGVSFVEWADKFAVMPSSYLELQLHHVDTGRRLTIIGHGTGRGVQVATALWRAVATLPGVSFYE